MGLLQNTLAIISSITGFGLNISGIRIVAVAHAEKDEVALSKTSLVLQRWSIITGILGVLITFLLAKPLSIWTFGTSNYANWFFILSINFIFSSLAVHKMVLLQGTRAMKSLAVSTVVYAVLVTLITIPVYYFFRMDGIIPVLVLSAALNYGVHWFFARKISLQSVQVSWKETLSRGKTLIQLGFLLSINVIFGHFTTYLLKLYFNFQQTSQSVLGLYVVATTLLVTYVGMIFNAMSTDFYPRLTEVQTDNSKVKSLVNDQIEIGLLLITPLLLLFYCFAPLLIKLLYSQDFIDVVFILKFALSAIIVKAIIWPLAFIILAKGKKRLYFFQEIVGDAMNILFTILFYEYLGLLGIGVAMFFNYSVYGIYVYRLVKNRFEFDFERETKKVMVVSLLLGVAAVVTVLLFDYSTAYFILPFICIYSFYYSYVTLNNRINIYNYLMKLKGKWKK